MRRKIIITSDNTPNIELYDESNENFDQYCEKLSSILKEQNITILKTSDSTTILRPSKIVGIEVKEVKEVKELKEVPIPPIPPPTRIIAEDIKSLKKENKIKKDIITDVK